MPSIYDGLASGTPIDGLALVSAIWAIYCIGKTTDGTVIAPNDPHWLALQHAARQAQTRPDAWLEQRHIYGDLIKTPRFVEAFSAAYHTLQSAGLEVAIATYADGGTLT